jgi:hypothetical protein
MIARDMRKQDTREKYREPRCRWWDTHCHKGRDKFKETHRQISFESKRETQIETERTGQKERLWHTQRQTEAMTETDNDRLTERERERDSGIFRHEALA